MLIYFFLLVISAITTVLIDDDKLLLHMLPLNYQWSLKLLITSNIMAFIFILLTSKQLMFQNSKFKSVRILTSLSLVHILFIMLGPVVRYYALFTPVFIINIIVLSLEVVVYFLKSALKNNDGSIFLLLSILAIIKSTHWGLFKNFNAKQTENLAKSQLRESNIQLQLRNVPIQSVAVGVLDMLKFLTEGKHITLISEIPDSFPSIVADEKRLIQILFNLLQNAVKYTSVGSVRVHADIHKGVARIHITDTGIGMNEETQLRAFQPYE